jgi:hypothetical protein
LAAQQDFTVAVYDARTGQEVASNPEHTGPVATVRVFTATDGQQKIISGGWGTAIIVSDPDHPQLRTLASFTAESTAWSSLAFRADRQPEDLPPGCVFHSVVS